MFDKILKTMIRDALSRLEKRNEKNKYQHRFTINAYCHLFLIVHDFFNLSFLIKRVERYESVYCIYAHWNSWSVCNEFRRFSELFLNLRKSNDCLIFLIKYNNANFAILFSRTWKCCLFLTCNESQKKLFCVFAIYVVVQKLM